MIKYLEFFAGEVFPESKTLDVPDIDLIVKHIRQYMSKNKDIKHLFAKYDMLRNKSYVYFKPDELVVPCSLASHSRVVKEIFFDYFKDFDEEDLINMTESDVRKFIKENFVIASDFTTVDKVADDWQFLLRCVVLGDKTDL